MTSGVHRLRLTLVPGRYATCRLAPESPIPPWVGGTSLVSITRTGDELSVVCEEDRVPAEVICERGYAALRVAGTLAPELVGVLVSLAGPLAEARIPILAIGTYDTDYVLVRHDDLAHSVGALRRAGHDVTDD